MAKIVFFDIETTGVMHWKNGIHQLSGCIEINGEVVDTFDYRVAPNPKAIVEAEALAVAGVTLEQIMAYRPMAEVFNEFENLLAKRVDKFNKADKYFLAGYNNAGFDNPFLRAWFKQNAKTEKDAAYGNYFGSYFWSSPIDVMVLAAEYLKNRRHEMVDFKLKTVASTLGIVIDETKLHDAEYDIFLTMEIYKIVTK